MPSHYGSTALDALNFAQRSISPMLGGVSPLGRFRDPFGGTGAVFDRNDLFQGQQLRRGLQGLMPVGAGVGALSALGFNPSFTAGLGPSGAAPANFWRIHSNIANAGGTGFAPPAVGDISQALQFARQKLAEGLLGPRAQDMEFGAGLRKGLGYGSEAAQRLLALARLSTGLGGGQADFVNSLLSSNPNVTVRL